MFSVTYGEDDFCGIETMVPSRFDVAATECRTGIGVKDGPLPALLEKYAFRMGSKRSRGRSWSTDSMKLEICSTQNPHNEICTGPVRSAINKFNTDDGSSDDGPRRGDFEMSRGGITRGFSY